MQFGHSGFLLTTMQTEQNAKHTVANLKWSFPLPLTRNFQFLSIKLNQFYQ